MTAQGTRALLTDGRVVLIRRLAASDVTAVVRLHEQLPERDRYLRFFTLGTAQLAAFAAQLTTPDDAHRGALGAFVGEELVGVAHYEVLDDPAEAEVALVVNHAMQTHGVGTLLLEHLVSLARERGDVLRPRRAEWPGGGGHPVRWGRDRPARPAQPPGSGGIDLRVHGGQVRRKWQ